jgi:hypothetical protein
VSVSAPAVKQGETVTVSATVRNSGGTSGEYEVTLKLNGEVEATRTVSVAAGGSTTLTFSLSKSTPGIYAVDVNGNPAAFTVEEPAQLATTVPIQEQQQQQAPGPPARKGTSPGVVLGIIGTTVVAAAIAAVLLLARRRTKAG